jgi:mannose/fructose/N-acetylgalactosamine-specific phosphotransferase system component IID
VEVIIVGQIPSTAAVTMSGRVGDLNAKQEAALKQVLDMIVYSLLNLILIIFNSWLLVLNVPN